MTHKPSKNASLSGRELIAKLAKSARGGLITVQEASKRLRLPPRLTALKLASLTRKGWLQRAKRGLYLILPLEVEPGQKSIAEDSWILAKEAFSPCYVGGWSAAEHWGLTEQIFRSTLVITAAHVRSKTVHLLNHEFRLFRVPDSYIKELVNIWRGSEQVSASSKERTIIDCLRSPELAGGITHLITIMSEYGNDSDHDFNKLTTIAISFANGAAWKRLGYLAELLWPQENEFINTAKKHITTGYVKLDPAIKDKGTLLRRWHVWINVTHQE